MMDFDELKIVIFLYFYKEQEFYMKFWKKIVNLII